MEEDKLKAVFAIKRLGEGLLWTVLGAVVFLYSVAKHQSGSYGSILQSPYLLVGLCSAALTCFGAVLMLQCRPELNALQSDEPSPAAATPAKSERTMGVLLVLGLSVAYCYLLPLIGFIIATAGYLYALMFIMGERRQVVLAFGAAAVSAVVYLIFALLLGVMLP